MTELYINNQLIESIDTEIALTLSSFKLDSLGTRKGSYSNVFDLPKTNANKLLFENCEIVTSVTSIPYQLNTCKVFVDGQLVVDGSAVIRETKQNYKVFISAGNSDFFKAIGTLKIKDIDLVEFDHFNSLEQIRDLRANQYGFVYPNIDYGFWEFANSFIWNLGTLQNRNRYFHPSMWIKTIIDRAVIALGYTLLGDLRQSNTYNNAVILCNGAVVQQGSSLAKYRHNINFNQLTGVSQKINFPERIEDKSDLYKSNIAAGQFVYSPNLALNSENSFDISLSGKVITNNPRWQFNGLVNIDLFIYNNLGTLLFTLTNSIRFENRVFGPFNIYRAPASGTLEREINFVYPNGESRAFINFLNTIADLTTLRFGWNVRVDRGSLSSISFADLEFSINQLPRRVAGVPSRNAEPTILVQSANVLPQTETVGDLLITIANIEGIIFQVDETTKTVRTSRIDRLINSKGNALDWSDKLDLTEDIETIYTIDNFAQRNIYRFANDDKDPFLLQGTGQGIVSVNNVNIETEKVVFESKFATVPIASAFNGDFLFGKVFTGDKYTFDGFTYTLIEPAKIDDFKPRLAVLTEIDSVINVSPTLTTLTNFSVNPLGMDFERAINDNYKLIRSVLVNTKVVKALFLLDLNDIVNLDFTRAIYVEHFGEYFYIESVNQFKINKKESCFITLVRI